MPESEHIHRWLLGSPIDGVSSGTCKHCGITKDFGKSENRTQNYTHSRLANPTIHPSSEMRPPNSSLKRILSHMLVGMDSSQISERMGATVSGYVKERARGLKAMGITENNPKGILKAVVYSVEQGYLPVPDIENVILEDTETAVLDMITSEPADIVAREIGILPKEFQEVMSSTYDKLGVNNALAAAAVWTAGKMKK